MSGYEYPPVDVEKILADPPVRYEGRTAYVQTARQAMHVSDRPGVSYVVIEDNAERIKLNRLVKAILTQ